MDKRSIIEYNCKMIKIANDGYLAIKSHRLVDKRDYHNDKDAEYFTEEAIYKVVNDLLDDIIKLNKA